MGIGAARNCSLTLFKNGVTLILPWSKPTRKGATSQCGLQHRPLPLTALKADAPAEISEVLPFWGMPVVATAMRPQDTRRKLLAEHYQIGNNPIDSASRVLIIKKGSGSLRCLTTSSPRACLQLAGFHEFAVNFVLRLPSVIGQ